MVKSKNHVGRNLKFGKIVHSGVEVEETRNKTLTLLGISREVGFLQISLITRSSMVDVYCK